MLALEIFDDYLAWLRTNLPIAYENLAPPAEPTELAALEEAIGYPLPADVKAVLGVHNGQLPAAGSEYEICCIPTLVFLSTAEIRKRWEFWAGIRRRSDIETLQQSGGTFPGAEGLIKPLYSSPGWIPLWADPAREDYIGVDLDPDHTGTPGQVINFGRNEERHFLCAADFAGLLHILREEASSGRWLEPRCDDDDEEYEQDDDGESIPWFGSADEHFFNALYARFETRPRQEGTEEIHRT